MVWFSVQLAVLLLVAFLIGLTLGWFLWRSTWRARPGATEPVGAGGAVRPGPGDDPEMDEIRAQLLTALEELDEFRVHQDEEELEPVPAVPAATVAPVIPVAPVTAVPPVATHDDETDDLTRISGMSTEMAEALASVGIVSYDRLQNASDRQIGRALLMSGIELPPQVGTWASQASYLADGDEVGFRTFVDTVIRHLDSFHGPSGRDLQS